MKLLIVDDSDDARELLRDILKRAGHDVHTAATGVEAIKLTNEIQPDLVILDLDLPDIDGHAVARMVQRSAKKPVKLIALSGHSQPVDIERSRREGLLMHLRKPITAAALLEHIDSLFAPVDERPAV